MDHILRLFINITTVDSQNIPLWRIYKSRVLLGWRLAGENNVGPKNKSGGGASGGYSKNCTLLWGKLGGSASQMIIMLVHKYLVAGPPAATPKWYPFLR